MICALAVTADGGKFVSAGADKLVKVWAYDDGICHFKGVGHSGAILAARIAPDQQTIVTCGEEGAIFIWQMPLIKGVDQDSNGAPAAAATTNGNFSAAAFGATASSSSSSSSSAANNKDAKHVQATPPASAKKSAAAGSSNALITKKPPSSAASSGAGSGRAKVATPMQKVGAAIASSGKSSKRG